MLPLPQAAGRPNTPPPPETDATTLSLSPLLRTTPPTFPTSQAVADTHKLQAAHDFVKPSFKLASCGWVVGPLGARWYYDTILPSSWVISSIDMDVGNTDVDPAYANITHRTTANKWAIPWAEDDVRTGGGCFPGQAGLAAHHPPPPLITSSSPSPTASARYSRRRPTSNRRHPTSGHCRHAGAFSGAL